MKDKGTSGYAEISCLIDNAIQVMIRDRQRGIIENSKTIPAHIVLSMIDATRSNLTLDNTSLAHLCVSSARAHSNLYDLESGGRPESDHLKAALTEISRSLALAPDDGKILVSAAFALEHLPQPQIVTLPNGIEVDWHGLFSAAITGAEESGKYRIADDIGRHYLRKLLAVRPSRFGEQKGRFERIANLALKTAFITESAYDDDRLNLLMELLDWATHAYRDGFAVSIGSFSDEFPSSRRSIYREIWRELYRLKKEKRLIRVLNSQSMMRQLDKLKRKWLRDEEMAGNTQTELSALSKDAAQALPLVQIGDWDSLAAMFADYFPLRSPQGVEMRRPPLPTEK